MVATAPAAALRNERVIASATVPFILDAQRILVNVAFATPDGGSRTALAWFNMGMAAPTLTKPLYRELQIDRGLPLKMRLGDSAIEAPASAVDAIAVGDGILDFEYLFSPHLVEAMLPASVLQDYVVTLDYERRTLTLARPGAKKPEGVAVPIALNPKTGLVTVDAMVDGRTYPVVIDAGSGYSWMRGDTVKQWLAPHPEWRRAEGAVGLANYNMLDWAFEKQGTIARIPEIAIGAVRLRNIGVLGTGPILGRFGDGLIGDLFWDNWQKAAPGPVVGWLGGNALKPFKLAIDYPNRMSYWQSRAAPDPHDLDQVGLTLVRRSERYFIGGVVRKASVDAPDRATVDDVEIGDELLAVDGLTVPGADKDSVLSALHGAPDERRTLVIERGGQRRQIEASVTAFD
ncbi:MAG: peptide-binding protein [Methylocystis sp.]|nr:peptide-binding protein [Methylocystis sp.]